MKDNAIHTQSPTVDSPNPAPNDAAVFTSLISSATQAALTAGMRIDSGPRVIIPPNVTDE